MADDRQTKEDDILALHAYFCGAEEGAHAEVLPATLTRICRLNHLDSRAGVVGAPQHLRQSWNEYCRDDRWLLWKLRESPNCDFREACRDIERLRRDAKAAMRRRAKPANVSRREARRAAMRALYAARVQSIAAVDALSRMRQSADSAREEATCADSLPRAIVGSADARKAEIERHIAVATNRAPSRISAVEAAILRAAVAEMLLPPRADGTPSAKMIINEAVEIAKEFGAEGGHKIVNGALDKIASLL